MLAEERYHLILQKLKEHTTVTVAFLAEALGTSSATVRRDLNYLHRRGLLQKLHGGATLQESVYFTEEPDIEAKAALCMEEKRAIAQAAAALIDAKDFIYIDAGTSTEQMIDFLVNKEPTYVTNGVTHAAKLAAKGFQVILLGGRVKTGTCAVVGHTALSQLSTYNFTKGFFGTNGISLKAGYSTPDPREADIKRQAMKQCKHAYILADETKFEKISSVTFAPLEDATIITTSHKGVKTYLSQTTVHEVSL